MLPFKIKRGKAAYRRLKAFEGVPTEYLKTKKLMAPEALRVLRLAPGRKVSSNYAIVISFINHGQASDVIVAIVSSRVFIGK